jgi:hypothetical protein
LGDFAAFDVSVQRRVAPPESVAPHFTGLLVRPG